MIKVDISDGFYRINLRPADVPKLGVVFPTKPSAEPLVAFPLVLPMGWTHTPPYFAAAKPKHIFSLVSHLLLIP